MSTSAYLYRFEIDTDLHIKSQTEAQKWLAEVYARANSKPIESYFKILDRVRRGSLLIETRGHYLKDYSHYQWEEMEIFNSQHGKNHDARLRVYDRAVSDAIDRVTPSVTAQHYFHVSCTGYISPSPMQKWMSKNQIFDAHTNHIYHMGCYASLPATRLAKASLIMDQNITATAQIIHSELCTLHLHPVAPTLEQMVIHLLFADGVIAYQMSKAKPTEKSIEALHYFEKIVPGTENAMTWNVADFGMQMTLSEDVPSAIAKNLKAVLQNEFQKFQVLNGGDLDPKNIVWAIHPGGPKILSLVQEILELQSEDLFESYKILRERGNMSSVTLPTIWKEILARDERKNDQYVVSLAFGPGLTLCGMIGKICK